MSVEVYGGGGGASAKLQEKRVSPSTAEQSVLPDSGYDGLSKVTVGAMPSGALAEPTISGNGVITSKVGTAGYLSAGAQKTKQLPTQAGKTVRPTTYSQTAAAKGVYTTGAVTVEGDANLIASNIKRGISIFGVSGTMDEGNDIYHLSGTGQITGGDYVLHFDNVFPDYDAYQILFFSVSADSLGGSNAGWILFTTMNADNPDLYYGIVRNNDGSYSASTFTAVGLSVTTDNARGVSLTLDTVAANYYPFAIGTYHIEICAQKL